MKTRIVYCKRDGRPGDYANVAFDFLGYTFQPRRAKNRKGEYFVGFLPAISGKAATAIRATFAGGTWLPRGIINAWRTSRNSSTRWYGGG